MKIVSATDLASWLPQKYIEREMHKQFFRSLASPEVTILYGPRQVGKSAEVTRCMIELFKRKSDTDIFYYNLDEIAPDFGNPERFLRSVISQKTSEKHSVYIFLDEAQRLSNVGVFVKYIYDLHLGMKIVLTGSASLDIKQKIKEPLTGRKIEFFLPPLNINEILRHNGIILGQLGPTDLTDRLLEEYLYFGGYPAVITEKNESEKKRKLEEITNSYITRDVSDLFGISDTEALRLVASFLARNIGGLFSRENVSKMAGISKYEVAKILNALEKSFIVFYIRPFAKDTFKEMIHRPKVFFYDLGIRNALLRKLDPILVAIDRGELFENAIGLWLVDKMGLDRVKYWRTNNQTEVDYVVLNSADKISAYEAKYTWESTDLPKNLVSFKLKYRSVLEEATVLSKENYWNIWK